MTIAPPPPPPVKPASVDTSKLKGSTPLSNADKIPSNWEINPTKDGISARNNLTGRKYEGSIADFNAFLKE